MKMRTLCLAVLVTSLLVSFISVVQCDIWDPFHTKEEKIVMWKDLWDAHTNTSYTSVGKTYNGLDIWLFIAGNLTGKRVLWDGELHGNEDKGSEILFLMAKWLLEGGDPRAVTILEENCVLFIPVVNDMNVRGNGNTEVSPYGVDLNRNFVTGWTRSDPASDEYSGDSPASEPETKALRNVFSAYRPVFYVNMHCGAGPYAAQYNRGNLILGEQVISRAKTVAEEMEITPYATRVFGSNGFAIGDAVALGVQSAWLIESVGIATAWKHLPEHYDELVNIYFPKCLALFIAMCESTVPIDDIPAAPSPTPNPTPSPTPEASNPIPSQTSSPSLTAPPSPPPTPKPSASLTPQSAEPVSASSGDGPVYIFSTVAVFSSIVAVWLIAKKRRARV